MRAARNNPKIKIVAINDPFIPVDYMKYMFYVRFFYYIIFIFLLTSTFVTFFVSTYLSTHTYLV